MTDSRGFGASRVESVVRSAARRGFAVLFIEQLAFALAPVLAGLVILLLVGTQILAWYWLALLALAGIAIAVARVRARNISRYQTAQILDRRLGLNDSLSTAWYLRKHRRAGNDGVVEFQLRQAEELAAGIEPAQAFPLRWQRGWALTGALIAVAFGLFAIRYLVTRSLSFEQALIPVQIAPVFERFESKLSGKNGLPVDPASGDQTQRNTEEAGQLPEDKAMDVPQGQGEPGKSTDPSAKAGAQSQAEPDKNGKPQDGEGPPRDADPGNSQADNRKSDQPAGNQASTQNADQKQQATGAQQGSQGLMDKMKDALSSLMAKMHQNSAQQSQQSNQPSQEDKTGSQNAGKAQQDQQQNARNQDSGQQQSAEGQPQGQASERTQAAQGRSSDSMPEKGADAHSGIGRQDGDKNVKEAEQLEAMGKLAEIIGKRSASVTGDMMVETPSGKQQLKTAYSQKLGHHSDSGGEINRDEVPLEDQQYVREYMELVRKQGKTDR
ncbi:MAG TPA: hypothetical protein VFA65_06650 [Bryobacteraceae bacterium]|nr:hypothetical protein [Bryobacteraceae bacterium]